MGVTGSGSVGQRQSLDCVSAFLSISLRPVGPCVSPCICPHSCFLSVHTDRSMGLLPRRPAALGPVVRKGEGQQHGRVGCFGCPSAPVLNRASLQTLGARLPLTQNGGQALIENANASPCLTLHIRNGQVTPVPFPPQPSSKKSLSVREFPEEPECESLVRAEIGSESCWPENARGSEASGSPRQGSTMQNQGVRLPSQWACCVRGSPRPATLHTRQTHQVLANWLTF